VIQTLQIIAVIMIQMIIQNDYDYSNDSIKLICMICCSRLIVMIFSK